MRLFPPMVVIGWVIAECQCDGRRSAENALTSPSGAAAADDRL